MRLIQFLIEHLFRRSHPGKGGASGWNRCGSCEHFEDDPAVLEEHFRGIGALSSVRGCSRGDAGICRIQDRYLLPVHSCPDFVQRRHKQAADK